MVDDRVEGDDALLRWLAGAGLAALDGIAGSALDVIGVIDRTLTVRYLNWTAPGLTREAVIGTSVLDLSPPDFRATARETYEGVVATGIGTRIEILFRNDENVLFWDVRIAPIRSDGQIIGLIAISSDVTEQRCAHADRDRFFSLSLDLLAVMTPEGLFKPGRYVRLRVTDTSVSMNEQVRENS